MPLPQTRDAPQLRLQQRSLTARVAETLRHFAPLGFISFGGPGVHVVLLRRRFVDELKWVSSATFNDLLSLGNALPGPGSTQLAFSIALVRNGTVAGLLAFCLWSFPAAIGMTALAAGVRSLPESLPPSVLSTLSGVNAAAVGMIALAAYQLALSSITDGATQLVFLGTAALSLLHSASWVYPACVLSGGLLLLLWDYRGAVLSSSAAEQQPLLSAAHGSLEEQAEAAEEEEHLMTLPPKWGLALVAVFVASVLAVAVVRSRPMGVLAEVFTSMFTAGTIIFGGGPVVIPLLRGYMVSTSLVSSRDFLLGFALLQSFPGPNFAFSCFLGGLAISARLGSACLPLGSALAFVGIFYPGILLKLALLPAYKSWKSLRAVKSMLRGLAPAASGLVLAAVWQLFQVGNLHASPGGHTESGSLASHPFWPIVAAFAFVLVKDWRMPPWLVVALGAAAGALKWKVQQLA